MLKWAREQTPFRTVYDVARYKPTIKVEKLVAWESGESMPSITSAKELAALYKLPLATFYLDEAPQDKRVMKYQDRRTVKGTLYNENNYELWTETQRLNSNRDLIVELYAESQTEALKIPIFNENTSIDEIADSIRAFLEIRTPFKYKKTFGNSAFRFYRKKLENHDICVGQVNGIELTEMKGFSLAYEIIPIIGINGKDFDRAKVFSLFHELAHIIRRTSSLCMIDFDNRNDDEEKICDKIAATILMPGESFVQVSKGIYDKEKSWSIDSLLKIADKYGVSTTSVLRRLYETSIISSQDYQRIYKILQAKFNSIQGKDNGAGFAEYHQKYLNNQGYLFSRTAFNAYGSGILSFGELCRMLNINRMHVANLERAVMFG